MSSTREDYPNLPADVNIYQCTRHSPMNIDGDKAAELKQLWIHADAEETEASKELDGSYMTLSCPYCKYTYTVYLGD